jgi:UDP:flavonoid glycosyltransferase YjiC (YdhE family)
MARILAYTSPARGHLFPITPILDELSRRGHQVALRTLASQVPLMQARGFDAAPISKQVEAIEHDDWKARSPQAALGRAGAKAAAAAFARADGPQAAADSLESLLKASRNAESVAPV